MIKTYLACRKIYIVNIRDLRDMTKISHTHHITKNGIVKKNPVERFELGFASKGNGLTVFNKRNYQNVAHINADRKVTFYVPLSKAAKDFIELVARTDNSNVSASQSDEVFRKAVNLGSSSHYGEHTAQVYQR